MSKAAFVATSSYENEAVEETNCVDAFEAQRSVRGMYGILHL